jgi:hypothetical protein
MKRICTVIAAIALATAAHAQTSGTVTLGAFAIGKGPGVTGYTSLLCASGQLAVGSGANPTCRTMSGDGTLSATGVFGLANIPSGTPMAGTLLATAIATPGAPAAGKVLIYADNGSNDICAKNSATSVFCMVNPASAVANQFVTNLAANGTLTARQPVIADVSGFGTGVATALGVNVGTAGSVVVNGGALGTPSSGVGANLTGVPISTGVSGLSAGCATALTTPSSANLRACFTDETGTGLIYFQGGDIGTPSAGVATNITALNATQLTTGTVPAARTNGHQNGTATNDNAALGEIGEYIESIITSGSAVSVVSGTPKTITSITLTAGDWEVDTVAQFLPANTTQFSQLAVSMSLVTNTNDVTPGRFFQVPQNTITSNGASAYSTALPNYRFSLSGSTTIFMVVTTTFSVSTMTSFGIIRARRAR